MQGVGNWPVPAKHPGQRLGAGTCGLALPRRAPKCCQSPARRHNGQPDWAHLGNVGDALLQLVLERLHSKCTWRGVACESEQARTGAGCTACPAYTTKAAALCGSITGPDTATLCATNKQLCCVAPDTCYSGLLHHDSPTLPPYHAPPTLPALPTHHVHVNLLHMLLQLGRQLGLRHLPCPHAVDHLHHKQTWGQQTVGLS